MATDFQDYVWRYERAFGSHRQPSLNRKEQRGDARGPLAQLFLFSNYLMYRCCVTVTRPQNEDWAFDMFQSLNATGTPLTAIETFLPLVTRAEENAGVEYKSSSSAKHMKEVDRLLSVTSNAEKTSLTNNLLTSFALAFTGEKLPNKFSKQRRWLNERYDERPLVETKRELTGRLSDVAVFPSRDCWLSRHTKESGIVPGTEGHPEKRLAGMLMQYMKDANFHIIGAVLSRYYEGITRGPARSPSMNLLTL